jgi:hypothetical protein
VTEFAMVYDDDYEKLLAKSAPLDKFDAIFFDLCGLAPQKCKIIADDCAKHLAQSDGTDSSGVVVLFYSDTIALMRHLFVQTKNPLPFKLSHVLHISSGINAPVNALFVNAQLSSPIQRVAAVFHKPYIADNLNVLANPTGTKNTAMDGDRFIGFNGNNRKCIGGDILSRICHMYMYDKWKNVFIGNFERPFLVEFVKTEPRKPTEKFRFTVYIGESNIRSVNELRMQCAVESISCNFDLCPSPAEVTQRLRELAK